MTFPPRAGSSPSLPPASAAASQDGRPHILLHIKSPSCWKAHHVMVEAASRGEEMRFTILTSRL